ncbi:hypothetical protein R8Z50_34310 [Longispora sp. K20-0274]|uniref:hypothetical protein n=1 Tax=Longispora sp. K20-0274 TaxID=3088255 RepID=UPI00399BE0D3
MSAWDSESTPPGLAAFAEAVRAAFRLGEDDIRLKGDEEHTYGYHRSRNWIMVDGDGDDDYSVQHPLDQGGEGNWSAAVDISLAPDRMTAVTGRLLAAARAADPRLAAVREFYGTVDGRTVTGWDSAYHRAVTADDTHLSHVHLSFYRSLAGADHADVLAVLTADDPAADPTPGADPAAEGPGPTAADVRALAEALRPFVDAAVAAELARRLQR